MDLQSFVFSYETAGNLSITYSNYTTGCTARQVPSCRVTDAWSICSTPRSMILDPSHNWKGTNEY